MSWVEKIESGERALDRLPMLTRVAEVLNVPVEALTNSDTAAPGEQKLDAFEVSEIRSALQTPNAFSHLFRPATVGESPDHGTLHKHVLHTWTSFQNVNWAQLGRSLPQLITLSQMAAAAHPGTDEKAIGFRRLLSSTYQVTASTLFKLKQPDLAWLAAERALSRAENTSDTLLISDAARRVAQGLAALNQYEQALNLIHADINRLEPGRGNAQPDYLSMYGMLFLMGAVIAAKAHKGTLARELLAEGHSVAQQLGYNGNERYSAFGPTNVQLHQVSVLLDLGDGDGAAKATQRVLPDSLAQLPKERRANFCIDVARAHSIAGRSTMAAQALLRADALFPHEIRNRPAAKHLTTNLIHRTTGPLASDILQLAGKVGATHD